MCRLRDIAYVDNQDVRSLNIRHNCFGHNVNSIGSPLPMHIVFPRRKVVRQKKVVFSPTLIKPRLRATSSQAAH